HLRMRSHNHTKASGEALHELHSERLEHAEWTPARRDEDDGVGGRCRVPSAARELLVVRHAGREKSLGARPPEHLHPSNVPLENGSTAKYGVEVVVRVGAHVAGLADGVL